MIINCNMRGGMGLANTMKVTSDRVLRSHPVKGVTRNLRKTVPGLGVSFTDNGPGTTAAFGMHNTASLGKKRTLLLISKIRASSLSLLGPRSVRDMSMLGSTTSTSVCNTHTTFNIMLVAAGGKGGRRGIRVGCGGGFS